MLADDEPSTDFVLDEWSAADRTTLSDALIESEIPHRWKGTTVIVAADAEHDVDDLLDAIEAGELLAPATASSPPTGRSARCSSPPTSWRRIRSTSMPAPRSSNSASRSMLKHPPYGLAPRAWASAVRGVTAINDQIVADSETPVARPTSRR